MLIGITGTDGAGKGTVVDYLVFKKHFVHYSARAIFETEIAKRGMKSSRPNMRLVANELRAQHGDDFLVTYYLPKITGDQNAIIESIRALAEVETLKKNGGILIAVDAEQKLRFDRIQKRCSETDRITFEQFVAQEDLENNDPDPHGLQKAAVMQAADYTITNNGSLEELHAQIEAVLEQIAKK